ncbi:MAG: hypothetical protein HY539_02420 [Deltaproteobacteria bacterium]|nr:hypothetical protein [Deltaproteobacteria bacterium]MBI4196655.1 hypothetical protein [Deltaproteobacteria bacterium]
MDQKKILPPNWSEWSLSKREGLLSLDLNQCLEQFQSVYETFASSIEETREIFRPQHETAIKEMQNRLQKLAQWQREQSAQFVSKNR